MPLLITRLTLAPSARSVPGFGICEITRPFFTFENFLVTLPVLQWAWMSALVAEASVLPFSFGTRQIGADDWSVNVAVTDRA